MAKHKTRIAPNKLEPSAQQCLEMLSSGYRRIQELCQQAQELNNTMVMKKYDSEMRNGLIVQELSEVNAELEREVEFLCLKPVVVKKDTCVEEFDKWLKITKQKDKKLRETLYGCPLKGSDGFCRQGRVPFGLKP